MFTYIYVYIYACIYVYVYIYAHIYIYTHTHLYTYRFVQMRWSILSHNTKVGSIVMSHKKFSSELFLGMFPRANASGNPLCASPKSAPHFVPFTWKIYQLAS